MRSSAPSAMSSVGSAARACTPCHDRLPADASVDWRVACRATTCREAHDQQRQDRWLVRTDLKSWRWSSASGPAALWQLQLTPHGLRCAESPWHRPRRSVIEARSVRTWQKVVADEHAEEDEVVYDALQVEVERQRRLAGLRPELQLEVVPHLNKRMCLRRKACAQCKDAASEPRANGSSTGLLNRAAPHGVWTRRHDSDMCPSRTRPIWKRMKCSAPGFSNTSLAGRPRPPPAQHAVTSGAAKHSNRERRLCRQQQSCKRAST